MFKQILSAFALIVFLVSCSSLKPVTYSNSKQQSPGSQSDNNKEIKFLDITSDKEEKQARSTITGEKTSGPSVEPTTDVAYTPGTSVIEKTSPLQLKYSQLLNTEVAQVQNLSLYQTIDDWYGTRYKFGGTTKTGIDCSAFVQTIFVSAFGITLPRMARDQYKATRRISRTELKEGDLLFFNTMGGISHVGIYLQNNKFVHASISGGVTISDMFETYYVRHFVAAGRVSGLNSASATATF